eukprot:Seg2600.2 transcript_id=Seg2600.2/GoldUCD/mRNA.D3Y31 product=Fucolectin-1 protein_id=Seg2600.2/GoldUCD/D3Y31
MIVDCWIIRKSCIQEADFSIIKEGHALEKNVIATFNSLSLDQCKENCVDDFRCRSINHADNDSVCELNDQIDELATRGALESKSGWTYHSTNHAVRNIGPVCRDKNPCQPHTYCMDICYCPGYQCVAMLNVALKRPAEQVSIHGHHKPSLANDGNRDSSIGKCAMNSRTKSSFWLVDLIQPYLVQSVAVQTTKEWGQYNPFEIRVGNSNVDGGKHNPLCAGNLKLEKSKLGTFVCANKFGRYVSLHVETKSDEHTSFCEVEVYGIIV